MLNKIQKLMESYICDNCLGRQFSQLLSGYSNKERGKTIRDFAALASEIGQINVDKTNFYGYRFRLNENFKKISKPEKCYVCSGFFNNLEKLSDKVIEKLKKFEFKTFVIGTQVSKDLLSREERIWEKVGIEHCEPIRAEINRELGKLIEKKTGTSVDLLKPDITVLLDLEKDKIKLSIRSLYVYGIYNKIKAGIPQCKWGTPGKYKTSIEEEIGRPLIKMTQAVDHKFHGMGREDIDARCFADRPFVIEAIQPIKRSIELKDLEKMVNRKSKYIRIKKLRIVDSSVVEKLKSVSPDKTYRALVKLEGNVKKSDLSKLKKLKTIVQQRTPVRVSHRRADLIRERKIKDIKYKFISPKKIELIIKAQSGTYIKELISGDEGRTKPSVSEVLGVNAKCEKLDVLNIDKVKL